ncbi:helix-turn-helix domain-containing protein [Flavobacterium sp. SM2513]|uniref:helix-turn-helix domain-containing protein n=1 Tax=Flavobacterium sp. SM2513 TaxID=3424766 RepID=UPI003D7FEACC
MQNKIDSLNTVVFSLDKRDTTRIVQLGLYIVKHTASEKQRYAVLQKISESYFRTNEMDKSIAYLFKAKDVAERIGDPEMLAQAYGSIANQYAYMNINQKARLYLDRAIGQIEQIPNGEKKYRLKALSAIEMGKIDFNSTNYRAANINYHKALREFKKFEPLSEIDRYNYRRSLYNIGNSYYYMDEPDSSEVYLQKALQFKASYSPELKFYIYSTLSEVYTYRGNYQQSVATLQSVLKDSNFKIPSLESEIYHNLSKNYKALGQYENYISYNEKYLALTKHLKEEDLKAINKAFSVEQKGFTDSITQSKKEKQMLTYAIILTLILGFAVLYYVLKKKRQEEKIYKMVISRLENQIQIPSQSDDCMGSETKSNVIISSETETDLFEKLSKFERAEKFRNPKVTLSTMAVQLKTNPTYLSAIIKMHKDKNFNSYINELRINYICQKIHSDPKYLDYKISYLAEECGFTSHSTFSTIFKTVTGIAPSVFLREAAKRRVNLS